MSATTGYWFGKRVLVTGGTGFIGMHLVDLLLKEGADVTVTTSRPVAEARTALPSAVTVLSCNLAEQNAVHSAVSNQEVVFHLAVKTGGVEFNTLHPASIFSVNMRFSLNLMEACREHGVDRVLVASTACIYPRICSIPTPEAEGFSGIPEPAHEGYGWSKRMEEFLGVAYMREFGLKVAIGRLYNVYGPGDHFYMESAGVIPSLIQKVFANDKNLEIWGDGTHSRSFLHVKDAAQGLLDLTEKYVVGDAVNLGSAEEITIRELAQMIVEFSGKKLDLNFNANMPAGQPRRMCDTRKAAETINFNPQYTLRDGLKETVDWYRQRYISTQSKKRHPKV